MLAEGEGTDGGHAVVEERHRQHPGVSSSRLFINSNFHFLKKKNIKNIVNCQ